ncbi:MAG: hypothetical protein C4524_05700 [Candidatus Zixiibacteriota bacterium]|nr:MAG: hypothetical protein C4524_05700 [candidate division Zixibacteria bacterium]
MSAPSDSVTLDLRRPETRQAERRQSARRQDSPEDLRRACREFEAIFLRTFLKEARVDRALAAGEEENANLYGDLVVESLARALAEGGGMGLAETLYRQLSPTLPARAEADAAADSVDTSRRGNPAAKPTVETSR